MVFFPYKVINTIGNANNRITSSKMSVGGATGIRAETPKFAGLKFAFGIVRNAVDGSILASLKDDIIPSILCHIGIMKCRKDISKCQNVIKVLWFCFGEFLCFRRLRF